MKLSSSPWLWGFAALLAAASPATGEPVPCERVPPGTALQEALPRVEPGAALCLDPGVHQGPLVIDRALTLWGTGESVIRSSGDGSTILVDAPGVVLQGFRVDGSGGRHDLLDAAVKIVADDVRVEGLRIDNALFGILAERCHRLVLRKNHVSGRADQVLGMRGDGIRLWEVREARIEGNQLTDSRDLVVWYSPGNSFEANRVTGGRYGTHFMYSHENRVENSHFEGNVVGIFAMYSRDLTLRRNVIAESRGAAGVGFGAKESGNVIVEENWFVGNTVGLYLDNSPLHRDERNRFEGNALRFGEVGVVFHGPAEHNLFHGNRFADLHVPVRVEGRGSAQDAEWLGNEFDDYAGYDLDGDGVGDVPYVLRTLEAELAGRAPAIRFFRGTPAMTLVDWVGRVVPLFQPSTLLEDPAPAMRVAEPPRSAEWHDAG